MRTCEKCGGTGHLFIEDCIPCPECRVSGVTAAPRSEGPRRLGFETSCKSVIFEEVEGALRVEVDGAWYQIGPKFERQLYELLRLRHEQGPPGETKT